MFRYHRARLVIVKHRVKVLILWLFIQPQFLLFNLLAWLFYNRRNYGLLLPLISLLTLYDFTYLVYFLVILLLEYFRILIRNNFDNEAEIQKECSSASDSIEAYEPLIARNPESLLVAFFHSLIFELCKSSFRQIFEFDTKNTWTSSTGLNNSHRIYVFFKLNCKSSLILL